jgi:hypothetical protein
VTVIVGGGGAMSGRRLVDIVGCVEGVAENEAIEHSRREGASDAQRAGTRNAKRVRRPK